MLDPHSLQRFADLATASALSIRGEELNDAQLSVAIGAVHHVALKTLDAEDRAVALAAMVVACRRRWSLAKRATVQVVPIDDPHKLERGAD